MDVTILSDDLAAAEQLRSALSDCDITCPIERVKSLDAAAMPGAVAGGPDEVIFLILTEEERSLTLLSDLCARAAARVVAVGAARDPKFILRVIHAGPSDFLDIDGDLATDVQASLERLKKTEATASVGGQLISVFSHSGGSGCSLVAANLAVALAEKQDPCLLCDFNFRRGDLATLLNVRPQFSINDIVKNLTKQRDVFARMLASHDSGVQLLAAPVSLADVRPVTIEAMSQIVGLARASFPFTVADLEDFFHPEQSEVLRRSDRILFVLRLDYTAIRNARRTIDYLEREEVDLSRIDIVVNQYGRPRELTGGQAEEVLGRKLNHFIPYDPKTVLTSMNRGVPLMQSASGTRIARALRQIANELKAPQPAPGTRSLHGLFSG